MGRYNTAALSASGGFFFCGFFFFNLIVLCALRTPLQRSEKLLAAQYVKWVLSLTLCP